MNVQSQIDNTFDVRSDTPPGKDPDSFSPTLRQYLKLLWSKPLPGGAFFDLVDTMPHSYLYHQSEIGEFSLSSDTVVPSFTREIRMAGIIEQIKAEELESFNTIGYTIGGMMIFPENRIDEKMTINGSRGFHPRIKDRFDLTMECIRRHYSRLDSPLSETLNRYADFFELFENYRGYVEFFLLQDMVSEDFTDVKFFTPFDDFNTFPLAPNRAAYLSYKQLSVEFIEARIHRILGSG